MFALYVIDRTTYQSRALYYTSFYHVPTNNAIRIITSPSCLHYVRAGGGEGPGLERQPASSHLAGTCQRHLASVPPVIQHPAIQHLAIHHPASIQHPVIHESGRKLNSEWLDTVFRESGRNLPEASSFSHSFSSSSSALSLSNLELSYAQVYEP